MMFVVFGWMTHMLIAYVCMTWFSRKDDGVTHPRLILDHKNPVKKQKQIIQIKLYSHQILDSYTLHVLVS